MEFKSQYLQNVYETVCKRNPNEPEFLQAVKEVLESFEPIVEKNIKFAFYEKVCDLGYLTRKLEKNEFILGNQYVMKKHIGELFIPMDEFKSFVDFCNSDDPYMVPAIAFTCDTPKNIAHAEKNLHTNCYMYIYQYCSYLNLCRWRK